MSIISIKIIANEDSKYKNGCYKIKIVSDLCENVDEVMKEASKHASTFIKSITK